ncbi:hypothetical protein EV191_103298 [Tamaricihabitans halophyticus]|uniref:Uncharacterized protein n=1 Tax=Tamaricihabitans halophyticus TaxID=1262583 RepID=A0A4R2QXZ7_9PSEU|nr:hypothetical protein [Tamaricihabitans halophyticus]TCP54254.1 hypothetical protein EV191_103298 [Tamaricihabitans halophyticus]
MNLGEVIAALQAKANELPTGMDTRVEVCMCNGSDVQLTSEIVVDHMAELATDGELLDLFAIVQGHPHRDENARTLRGAAEDADEQLRNWTAEED